MDIKLKSLNREIDLSKPLLIVTSQIGKKYLDTITPMISEYKVADNLELNQIKKQNSNILLIGNLTDNKLCEYFYHKMIIFSDKRYPGGNAYEIRLIVNPFGHGNNVIYIGYSEEEGLKNAVKAFPSFADENHIIHQVSFTDSTVLPIDRYYTDQIIKSGIPEEELIFSIHTSYWWLQGLLAFLNNSKESFKNYDQGLASFISRAHKICTLGTNMHLHMVSHVVTIWVLEHNGYFDEELREEIFDVLYQWANSEEGTGYLNNHHVTGKTVCHNHSLFCALALKILSELFTKRCESNPRFKEWDDYAEKCFSSFNRGGWKPLCDDSAYSVEVTLVLVSIYSLFEDNHRFLNHSGHSSLTWLKAVIGNDGFMPSYGDGTTYNPTATVLLRLFAYWYKDRELISILKKLPDDIRYKLSVLSHHTYDIGLDNATENEKGTKLSIIRPDEEIFYSIENSEEEASTILDRKPTYPIDDCFDKISVRDKEVHLLIDGLSSPYSHAYHDGGGLLDFTMNGVTWLVEENCYRWPETEHCNMITITRDGSFDEPAPFAKLLKAETYEYGTYIAIEIDDYNGCLWQREYILINQAGLIIRDHVTPKEENDYAICFHVKTPSTGELENNVFSIKRKDINQCEHKMVISDLDNLDKTAEIIKTGEMLFMCGGSDNESTIYNHGTFSSETGIRAWKYKYHEESLCVTRLETRISGHYRKNEKKVMTHLFMIDKPFDVDIKADVLSVICSGIINEFNVIEGQNHLNSYETEIQSDLSDYSSLNSQIENISIKDGIIINEFTILLTDDNSLQFYHENNKINEVTLMEQVTKICVFNDHLIAGTKEGLIVFYDLHGYVVREKRLDRIPSIFATWETYHFEVTSLAQVTEKGKNYLAVGTGDNQIKLIDDNGDLIFSSYIYATIPDKIFCFDIENDGENEIITIGSESMNAGCVYNFKFNGKDNPYPRIGGWLNNIIDISVDDDHMLCGLKYGDNLILLRKNSQFDIIFKKKLGGKVNGVLIDEDTIYAVTSKGYLLSYSIEGQKKNMIDLGGAALKIVKYKNLLLVETSKGINVFDTALNMRHQYDGFKLFCNEYIHDNEKLVKMNNL
ncbi:MAG: hypothetical protein JXQ23_13020 [Clostridia bacterium]|nr:hypothetical protein [Clostridia bacterium]